MPFAAALSTKRECSQALEEVCTAVQNKLGTEPDLALLFYAPDFLQDCPELAREIHSKLKPRCVLGCPGETIIGQGQEIEQSPAISLWVAKWSQSVKLHPFHIYLEHTSEGMSLLGWPDALFEANPEQSAVLLLGDPATFPADAFLRGVNEQVPGLRVVGGQSSGITRPGECRMIFNGQQIDQGAVAVLIEGPMKIRPVVSQGCRPIGQHMIITKATDNVIEELGGKTPFLQLQELFANLIPEDQALVQNGLHIGCVMNEYQQDFHVGDFLIRNVMALERDSGAMAIAERVRVGQTVQFHVRDANSADEELHNLLQIDLAAHEQQPAAALLFSCNGRGTRLFDAPHHDAQALWSRTGEIPLAGFFAQGELGPVGGKNFIHGFTASVVLFEE